MAGDEAADQRRSESEELNYTRRRRNEPHARQLLCTRVLMKLPRVGFEATFVGSNPTSIWQKTLGHEQAPRKQ